MLELLKVLLMTPNQSERLIEPNGSIKRSFKLQKIDKNLFLPPHDLFGHFVTSLNRMRCGVAKRKQYIIYCIVPELICIVTY